MPVIALRMPDFHTDSWSSSVDEPIRAHRARNQQHHQQH